MAQSLLPALTGLEFKARISQLSELVLVVCGGAHCAPCVALEPVLLTLLEEFPAGLSLYHLDAEEELDFAADFQVRGLPTALLFKGGRLLERIVGAQPRSQYVRAIKKHF